MTAPLLLIAAGGTGGHMFPAQALAEAMIARGWRVKLSTDARGARYAGGFPASVEVVVSGSGTFARGGVLAKLAVPFKIAGGILGATARMLIDRPAVVVGFGGYPTIPALSAAFLTRRPRMIHEQNGVLGRVNKLFARRVTTVACGTWPTALPDGLRFLTLHSLPALFDFPADMARLPTEVNRLSNQVLVTTYEAEWGKVAK